LNVVHRIYKNLLFNLLGVAAAARFLFSIATFDYCGRAFRFYLFTLRDKKDNRFNR
jgi:hypothetical protein